MHHLEDARIVEQIEHGRQIDAVRQRVDRRGDPVRPGDLYQAELGPERALAHELGIEANEGRIRQPRAQRGQRVCIGNQ